MEPDEIQQEILLSTNTKAVCTKCGREDAPYLFLKRSHGKYALLCKMVDGSGCWPLSCRNLCRYSDPDQIQCIQLAEYVITFGADETVQTECCSDHVGSMIKCIPSGVYKVYPQED